MLRNLQTHDKEHADACWGTCKRFVRKYLVVLYGQKQKFVWTKTKVYMDKNQSLYGLKFKIIWTIFDRQPEKPSYLIIRVL